MKLIHHRARAGAIVVPTLALIAGCGTVDQPATTEQTVELEYVIDGDTIAIEGGERVRFLGVDAPEVGRNGALSEPCADEATALVESTTSKGQVTLVTDPSQPDTDRYGRTLAYVEVGNVDLSAELLKGGLGDLYRAADDITRYSEYQRYEAHSDMPDCATK